jgi:hypothetical protein
VVVVYIAAARLAGTTTRATGFFDVELLELDASILVLKPREISLGVSLLVDGLMAR